MDMVSLSSVAERIFVGLADSRLRSGADTRIPIVHIKDVRDGFLPDARSLDTRAVPSHDEVRRYQIRDGDVVLTCRGTKLRMGIAAATTDGAIISANVISVRTGERLLPQVLLAFLRTAEGQRALRGAGQGSTGLSLKVSDVARLQVPVPPLDMQRRLAALIEAAEEHHRAAVDAADRRRAIAQGAVEHVLRRGSVER